jgi:hypothetical protein
LWNSRWDSSTRCRRCSSDIRPAPRYPKGTNGPGSRSMGVHFVSFFLMRTTDRTRVGKRVLRRIGSARRAPAAATTATDNRGTSCAAKEDPERTAIVDGFRRTTCHPGVDDRRHRRSLEKKTRVVISRSRRIRQERLLRQGLGRRRNRNRAESKITKITRSSLFFISHTPVSQRLRSPPTRLPANEPRTRNRAESSRAI